MMRSFRKSSVISVSSEQFVSEKSKEVLHVVKRKGPPLTPKQVEFCSEECIVRYLKARGNHVRRAAKQLRSTLTWRAMLDVDYLTADEFSAELASGIAFVAGQDEEGRPVVIVRLKPDNIFSAQAQKQFLRYFAFTMEVAISCMPNAVQQCVLIFDASCLKRGSSPSPPGLSVVFQLLKVLGEHYPERLSRAFIVDAPSMFHLFWKGVGKFLDQKMREKLKFVYSRNFCSGGGSAQVSSAAAGASSVVASTAAAYNGGGSAMSCLDSISNRILWEEEEDDDDEDEDDEQKDYGVHHGHGEGRNDCAKKLDPILENGETASSLSLSMATQSFRASGYKKNIRTPPSSGHNPLSTPWADASLLSDKNHARSMSFAAPTTAAASHKPAADASLVSDKARARSLSFAAITAPRARRKEESMELGRSFWPDLGSGAVQKPPANGKIQSDEGSSRRWLSLSFRFSREEPQSTTDANHPNRRCSDGKRNRQQKEVFGPYYNAFLRRTYSEAAYRSLMKPPLAGLISILSSELKLRQSLAMGGAASACGMEAMLINHHLQLAG